MLTVFQIDSTLTDLKLLLSNLTNNKSIMYKIDTILNYNEGLVYFEQYPSGNYDIGKSLINDLITLLINFINEIDDIYCDDTYIYINAIKNRICFLGNI